MKDLQPVAITIGDVHLTVQPPVSRSPHADMWIDYQWQRMDEVRRLCDEFMCPLLIAGDVFDVWYPPAKLINAAIRMFRQFPYKVYAVPGQHDLQNHRIEAIENTGYHTLELAGVIETIPNDGKPMRELGCNLYGLPWMGEIPKVSEQEHDRLNVLVAHAFIWTSGENGYVGADDEDKLPGWLKKLQDFNVAIFGDNHKGFWVSPKTGPTTIWNGGAFVCRTKAEIDYRCRAGIVYSDGTIEPYYFSTDADLWSIEAQQETVDREFDLSGLIDELKNLDPDSIDFQEIIDALCRELDIDSREVVSSVLDTVR